MNRRSVDRIVIAFAALVIGASSTAFAREPRSASPAPVLAASSARVAAVLPDTLRGKSGKLWMRLLEGSRSAGISILRELFGDSAASRPGVYTTSETTWGKPFSFINLVPFSAKVRGMIGSYRIGRWPAEKRAPRSDAYENPDGFIQVTADNEDTQISEHFRLRDFLTHDQQGVWPKYMVLREPLIDKLELIINALRERGIGDHVVVMSGFRTPQYNEQGVGRRGGRAEDSRHQFGDAADIFVDNNGDGRMDDLNHDGRVNARDARFLEQIAQSVEDEHPDLVGGMGVYSATRAHGPFLHVDVRGTPARWGLQ